MRRVLLIALVLGSVSAAPAQTGFSAVGDCKLKLAQAPAIRGILLGMTIDQALGGFSGVENNADVLRKWLSSPRFGLQTVEFDPSATVAKEKFIGIRLVYFGFLDGKLNFFSLGYSGPHWTDVDQFAAKVAETLNLPGVESWRSANGGKTLTCDGFVVSVNLPAENSVNTIKVRNLELDVNKLGREREEAQRETARRAFKP